MTRYRENMSSAEVAELLAECAELDAAYTRADADAAGTPAGPPRTVFCVHWDNGAGACGTFPEHHPTPASAQTEGDAWAAECNVRDRIDAGTDQVYAAQAVPMEIPDLDAEEPADPMRELYKAALSRGQP